MTHGTQKRWPLWLLWLGLLALAASSILYSRIGIKNIFQALTFSGKIIGAIVFLCAAVSVLAIFGMAALLFLRPSDSRIRTCSNLVITGAVTSLTVSVIIFVVQVVVGELTSWLWAWGLMAVGCVCMLLYVRVRDLPVPSAGRLIGGLSLGLLVSLVSVVYTDFYLPSATVPLLSASATVKTAKIDTKAGTATISFSIQIRNQQSVGAYILGAFYDVAGRKESFIRHGASPLVAPVTESDNLLNGQPFGSFVSEHSYDLLQEGPIGSPGDFLNPGEAFGFSDTLTIPEPTSYDAIQLSFHILIMRDDRFQLEPNFALPSSDNVSTAPAWVRGHLPKNLYYVTWHGRILPDNYLLELIRSPQVARVWYILPPLHSIRPYSPNLVGVIVPEGSSTVRPPASFQILNEINFYGLESEGGGEYVTVSPAQLHIPSQR